jgi:hypothetical protein
MTAALDAWSSADLPLDHAFATLSAMYVLPPADVPTAHVDRARTYLIGLHATSLLDRYDAAQASVRPSDTGTFSGATS